MNEETLKTFRNNLRLQRLFVVRVLEGAVQWDATWDMPLDEFEWLYSECEAINQKIASDLDEMKKNRR